MTVLEGRDPFAAVPEQLEAKRLLGTALRGGDAHAFLFHGPPGVGKTTAAMALAGALLGDERRVLQRAHPDLRIVEPLGEMIRIDEIRALHHDLHMRPFEAERRVYLILRADLLNPDGAAEALLKDLEEPPPYATIVLVADELGPIPETIRSRCQLVPFRRLSEGAVREWLIGRTEGLGEAEVTAVARVAAGRLDRAQRLLDPAAQEQRAALIARARATYIDPSFDPGEAAATVLTSATARGAAAREHEEGVVEGLDMTERDAEQRVRRAQRGAEREELLAELEELAGWYRDLMVVGAGAESAAINADRLDDLREDATRGLGREAEQAAALVRAQWRTAQEFNVNASLAFEALFVRLHRVMGARVV